MSERIVSGFSRWTREEKRAWINRTSGTGSASEEDPLDLFTISNPQVRETLDAFSENTLGYFALPYGVAPNFLINGQTFTIPMVTEESSVVAAAASAAKFWLERGGFHTQILSTTKVGQLFFHWSGPFDRLQAFFPDMEAKLLAESQHLGANMTKRGGGVSGMELLACPEAGEGWFQIRVQFLTSDSMGANFINSHLESFARSLAEFFSHRDDIPQAQRKADVLLAILSNYTPECLVSAEVSCPVADLSGVYREMQAEVFAERFWQAVHIAETDVWRATTHNKGIFNGVDAVVLATGNDFRAVEAAGHAFAARDGRYRSLSTCSLEEGQFRFGLTLPLAVGTVGGITGLHPLARKSLAILGQPNAGQLMEIIAAVGLAQNFAAVRSLVTSGIQEGHMRMHLINMLVHLQASSAEKEKAQAHFSREPVSFAAVQTYLENLRS